MSSFTFPIAVDGIDCTVTARPDHSRYIYPGRRPFYYRAKNTGLYIAEEGETVLENFALRTSRPVDVYRKFAEAAVARFDPTVKLRWDRHTGCSMCQCSPGFKVFNADRKRLNLTADGFVRTAGFPADAERFDIFVTIGAPLTEVTPEAEHRLAQLLANPGVAEVLAAR